MSIHHQHGLDLQELQDLCRGKINWRKCPSCDNHGRQYYDGETGMGVSPSPTSIEPERLAWEICSDCHGLAFQFFYTE